MRRLVTHALPALALLLALAAHARLAALASALLLLLARTASLALVLAGSGSVWWALRAWQLRSLLEAREQAGAARRFLQRYRRSSAGSSSTSEQLPRAPKRLPLPAHLRTCWGLPPDVADALAQLVQVAVRDYVGFWYQPLSPANDDFPADLRLLLADLLGALAARVLALDSSQALALAADAVEILRLHLGWFREAYAQLGEDHPEVFGDADAGTADDENLQRRQACVASFVQQAAFLHPGCAALPPSATRKATAQEPPEVVYLRHVASQLLVQLKPELGAQYGASVFVSLAMNLMREATTFKILKPMAEYAQQRYANELVLTSLQAFLGAKDGGNGGSVGGPMSPIGSLNALSSAASSSISGVGGLTLSKLRLTKSFLYKATKRSGSEHGDAVAFQAVVGDAAAGETMTTTTAAIEIDGDGDEWPDAPSYALDEAMAMSVTPPSSTKNAAAQERKSHFATSFSLNDRLSIPRTGRLKAPRAFLPGASVGGLKAGGGGAGGSGHIDDLKNIKANIGSSLSKVKRRFRTLSGHPNDPETPTNAGSVGFPSTQTAARMMKKPGMLLQKALRRSDGPAAMLMSPLSPTNSLDELLTPPPLSDDDDFVLGDGDVSDDPPSPSKPDENLVIEELAVDTAELVVMCDNEDDEADVDDQLAAQRAACNKAEGVRERAVEALEKAVTGYVRMCLERPEMRSSARARELFEFLSAMEDVFLLGFLDPCDDVDADREDLENLAPHLVDRERGRNQQYWHYLAQDRPETPFLNDHRTFVTSRCPMCAESEAFCSPRGVQWILVALEKGMLWKYMTALHLNQLLTERFYDPDESVLRHGKLMENVLKSLFQLNQLSLVTFEIPRLLGRKDEMDEAFGVSTSANKQTSASGGDRGSSSVVCILESVWEIERYVPLQGWTKTQDKRWQDLPSSEWIWEGDWTLDGKDAAMVTSASVDPTLALEPVSSTADTWEYAKTYEDRFHEKERKFDSVRRRKWVRRRRQLPFVLSAAPAPPRKVAGATSAPAPPQIKSPVLGSLSLAPKLPSSPPALFGAASLPVAPASTVLTLGAAGKVRNVKQFFDLSKRGKAKTDDTVSPSPPLARKPLMKRRSSSFDRSMLASPIADLALGLESPKTAPPLTPEKAAASPEKKKKRRSIPSLRRSHTSSTSSKDAKGALELTRSTTTGSTAAGDESADRRASLLDSDGDDDRLCFRCLASLHADDEGDEDAVVAFHTCPSCQQRVCGACIDNLAFLVFPPPLEASTKTHVCGACYDRLTGKYRVKVEAHVSRYFLRDLQRESSDVDGAAGFSATAAGDGSDTEPSASSSSSSMLSGKAGAAHKFEVVGFVKGNAAFAWSTVKTLQDFESLEKQLAEKLKKQEKKHGAGCRGCHWKGVDYTELLGVEPSLKQLPVAALSYEKRLYVLEEFVQSLLATDTLCQSPAVQKFLALSNAGSGGGVGRLHPFSPTTAAALARSAGDFRGEFPGSPSAGPSNSALAGATGVVMMESGKWRKGRWVAPATSSNETKVRLLQKLEVSLFAVVGELFEFDGIGVVRRQLFAMSRSFIKAFLSASHFRKLEKQYLSLTDPKKVAAAIVAFREYMFPDPDALPAPAAPPAALSATEMQALRKDSLDAILASFPSTLVSLFGDVSCENAALKLHEFLQHEVFVKNLLFSVTDEVLQQLFPEFVLFKGKSNGSNTK